MEPRLQSTTFPPRTAGSWLREAFDSSLDGVVVLTLDGRLVDANATFARLVGRSSDALRGLPLTSLTPIDERRGARQGLDELLLGTTGLLSKAGRHTQPGARVGGLLGMAPEHDEERQLLDADGRAIPVLWRVRPVLNERGEPSHVVALVRDLRGRRDIEHRLAASEARYASLFHFSGDAILIHDADGGLVDANRRAVDLLGYSAVELQRLRLGDLVQSAWRGTLREALDTLGAGARATDSRDTPVAPNIASADPSLRLELELVKRSGEIFTVELAMQRFHTGNGHAPSAHGPHLQAHIRDLTEKRHAEQRLHRASFHDPVTGLPNRSHLLDRLQLAIDRAGRRPDSRFALLAIGVDRIDLLADGLGHVAGETLMRRLAERLRAVAPDDAPARVGDGLFAILLHAIRGVIDARQLAEDISRRLQSPFRIGGRDVYLGVTVGIVTGDGGYERAEDCLRDADIALADARRGRTGGHRVFDPEMHDRLVDRLDLEHGLRSALEADEMVAFYQPIVDLATGRIDELEALVRWRHPRRGLLLPDAFLPLADELDLDGVIDDRMLHIACRQMVAWRDALGDRAPRRIAVNVASRRFAELELVSRVRHALDDSGLEADALRLEVTEGAMIEETDTAVAVLGQLLELGVRVSLDDFGTGYSSLGYLHRFPVDTLKIDRSFVSGPSEDSPVLQAAVALGHELGKEVVAEGVETEHDLERVRRLGCEHAQGWLFARPLPADDATALLRSAPRW
ncbi:MAG: EAL domain-containing protein [Acidobacteriota bacterium]